MEGPAVPLALVLLLRSQTIAPALLEDDGPLEDAPRRGWEFHGDPAREVRRCLQRGVRVVHVCPCKKQMPADTSLCMLMPCQ